MRSAFVVDTNVLILASVFAGESRLSASSVPVTDPRMLRRVWTWLMEFSGCSDVGLVLDCGYQIMGEYHRKLSQQDFGLFSVQGKIDRGQVLWVSLVLDGDGYAILPAPLVDVIHDRADRKLVAACLEALRLPGTSEVQVVNACDTDWLGWEPALRAAGVGVVQLLGDWVRLRSLDRAPRSA